MKMMQRAMNVMTKVGLWRKMMRRRTLMARITVAVRGTTTTGAQSVRFSSKETIFNSFIEEEKGFTYLRGCRLRLRCGQTNTSG